MKTSWTQANVPFMVWLKHVFGVGSHDWESEPVVRNPAYIDNDGHWRPPVTIYKCKWCTATVEHLL